MSAAIWRRVMNMIGFGTVTQVNDAGPVMMLQVRFGTEQLSDAVPLVQHFGFSGVPPIGSNVACNFLGGDRANKAAIASNHRASRPTGRVAGESTVFNAFGMSIYLSQTGIVVNAGGQPVEVNNATTVTVNASTEIIANTPVLKCSGDIIDNYATNTRTMAGMRSVYDSHTHNQPNDSHGDTEQPTDVPNQQM